MISVRIRDPTFFQPALLTNILSSATHNKQLPLCVSVCWLCCSVQWQEHRLNACYPKEQRCLRCSLPQNRCVQHCFAAAAACWWWWVFRFHTHTHAVSIHFRHSCAVESVRVCVRSHPHKSGGVCVYEWCWWWWYVMVELLNVTCGRCNVFSIEAHRMGNHQFVRILFSAFSVFSQSHTHTHTIIHTHNIHSTHLSVVNGIG